MLDNVGEPLRVGRGSRAAAVNVLGQLRNLVGDAVRNVRARRHARIGAQHHGVARRQRHDGRPGAHFARAQIVVLRVMENAGISA